MNLPPNIILVGFMGSGKTTSGRELSRIIGFNFLDLDEQIESKEGRSVEAIFKAKGEEFFRLKERQEIEGLGSRLRTVICPGGGAWLDPRNRKILLDLGWCVWLEVSPEESWNRIKTNIDSRPLIHRSSDPIHEIRNLLKERESAYALAHQKVSTDGMGAREVAFSVLELLKKVQPFSLKNINVEK